MLIEPIGGLANRTRVILGAILYCEELGIDLRINWLNDNKLTNQYRADEIAAGHFSDIFIAEKEHDQGNSRENSLPNFYRGTDAVVMEGHISNFEKKYLQVHERLSLTDDLQSQADRLFLANQPYDSIHVRRTDHLTWLKNSNLEVTPLSKFEDFISDRVDERVFLATDCVVTRDYLVRKYPTPIFYQGNLSRVDGAAKHGSGIERPSNLQQAAIDIFLCVRSQVFVGTKLSSFSSLIQMLRRVRLNEIP